MNQETMSHLHSLARVSIGMNETWEQLWDSLKNHTDEKQNYPPYNIINEEGSQKFIVEIALAGFTKEDIDIDLQNGILTVSGKSTISRKLEDYIYRGIGTRKFKKSWTLSDHVIVQGASFVDGILSIELERIIPEEKKPKKILITSK